MTTQVTSKSATNLNLLERFKQSEESELVPSQSRPAATNRRSWYALGLVLRLAFFLGLVTQTLTLWSRW